MPMQTEESVADERSSERMAFRTKPRIRAAIRKAAALAGVHESAFAMGAAYKAAMETIAAHETTVLQPGDHAVFFAALDRPAAPNAKLRAACGDDEDTFPIIRNPAP
ncbi:DUF1778 domain-containing protein [Novosphingobium sp. M1R2S20]|uniref:DUF1778 domain-containing protein n=1 Tax=Novosphingobium rhizovicinum TaxID=3228928 RepID=A0ABV3RF44_9SPHN